MPPCGVRKLRTPVFMIFARPMPPGSVPEGVADAWVTRMLRQGDASLQEAFADEIADEARGSGEAQPPRQRNAC